MNDSLKIIADGYVLTGDAGRRAGAIALLLRNGRIAEFARDGEILRARFPQAEFVDATGHAIVPGFVDPHLHGESILLRYLTAGRPLARWEKDQRITSAFARFYSECSPADLRRTYELAYVSAARSGFTTVAEFGFGREGEPLGACVEAATRTGVRAVLGIHNGEQADAAKANIRPGISYAVILPDEDQLTTYGIQSAVRMSRQEQWPLVLSSGETRKAFETLKKNFARSMIQIAGEYKFLDGSLQLHHQAQYDPGDLEALAASKIPIALSPVAMLAKGVELPPFAEMIRLQIPIALATDWGFPDPFGSVRSFVHTTAALGLGPRLGLDLLAMVTSIPARILGLGQEIGSIEIGKRADLTLVDIRGIRLGTAADLRSADAIAEEVLMHGTADRVSDVLVNGAFVLRSGQLVHGVEEELVRDSRRLLRSLGAIDESERGAVPELTIAAPPVTAPALDVPGDEGFRVVRRGTSIEPLPPPVFPLPDRNGTEPELPKNVRRMFGDDDDV
jgi:5-methylthioadenosine/S-adenosylhomocysteine deaminase